MEKELKIFFAVVILEMSRFSRFSKRGRFKAVISCSKKCIEYVSKVEFSGKFRGQASYEVKLLFRTAIMVKHKIEINLGWFSLLFIANCNAN